ncbi:hypothetical protein DFS34DRAFT_597595 [Phlyctochytrium arcticum]|nr:hypothetical protein DFS34DRAFT_597595 [Phlyctochytrium arcticum]
MSDLEVGAEDSLGHFIPTDLAKRGGKKGKVGDRKKKKKRRDRSKMDATKTVTIFPKDEDIDDEGIWAEKAFEALTVKADSESITNYVFRQKWETVGRVNMQASMPNHESNGTEQAAVLPTSQVAHRNALKIEKRLRWTEAEGGKLWLNASNELLSLKAPLSFASRRPIRPSPSLLWKDARTHPAISGSDSHMAQSPPNVQLLSIALAAEDDFALWRSPKSVPGTSEPITDSRMGSYLLMFDVGSLKITDHPLMTEEMRIGQDIEGWVKTLHKRRVTGVVNCLSKRLESARDSYSMLKDAAPSNGISIPEVAYPAHPAFHTRHLEQKKRKFLAEVRALEKRKYLLQNIQVTRMLRDAEAQTDRTLQYKIAQGWTRVKNLREVNGYTTTNLQLRIESVETDEDEDKQFLGVELDHEVAENQELDEINRRLREVNHQTQPESKSVVLEPATLEKVNDDSTESRHHASVMTEDSSSSVLSKAERRVSRHGDVKSQKLNPNVDVKADMRKLQTKIHRRLNSSHRQPGLPILFFEVQRVGAITATEQCSRNERLRRESEPPRLSLRILHNRKEITRTSATALPMSNFEVRFSTFECYESSGFLTRPKVVAKANDCAAVRFGARIAEIPRLLEAEIWERSEFGENLLARVPLSVPKKTETIASTAYNPLAIEFSGPSCEISGNPDPLEHQTIQTMQNGQRFVPIVSGILNIGCAWGIDDQGATLGPQNSNSRSEGHDSEQPSSLAVLSSPSNISELTHWIESVYSSQRNANMSKHGSRWTTVPDRNEIDQQLTALTNHINVWRKKEICRFDPPEWIRSLSQDFAHRNKLADSADAESLGPIPLFEQEIDEETLLAATEVRESGVLPSLDSSVNSPLTPSSPVTILPHTYQQQFLYRICNHDLLKKVAVPRPKKSTGFISEVMLPQQEDQEFFLAKWLRPRRRLRPHRDDRKDAMVALSAVRDCRLVVQVLRGNNFPTRIRKENSRPVTDLDNEGPIVSCSAGLGQLESDLKSSSQLLRPYVQVSFQNQTSCTATADGFDPLWNDTVTLPVSLPSKETDEVFNKLDFQSIRFDLFDEMLTSTNGEDIAVTTQRRDKIWFGSVVIPFSVLRKELRLAGEFPVRTPVLLPGYEVTNSEPPLPSASIDIERKVTKVYMFLTLEPPIAPSEDIDVQMKPLEALPVMRRSTDFFSALPKFVQDRHVVVTTSTLAAQITLVTRYIRPQRPPKSLKADLQALLRYVSLIPLLPPRSLKKFLVVSTTDQLMNIGAGGWMEHAIMLVNYMKWVNPGRPCWVLLGKDVAQGRVAWVVTIDPATPGSGENCHLWDPISGEIWSPQDIHCPLIEVGELFDEVNTVTMAQMEFDLNVPKSWRPFFHRGFPKVDGPSLQIEEPLYKVLVPDKLKDIENGMERAIVDAVEHWREAHITRWNRLASRALANALPLLEVEQRKGNTDKRRTNPFNGLPDLSRLSTVYHIRGSPISMPYTDTATVLSEIKAMEIHSLADDGCEFACGVSCFGFEGDVIGIWIWMACLLRAR